MFHAHTVSSAITQIIFLLSLYTLYLYKQTDKFSWGFFLFVCLFFANTFIQLFQQENSERTLIITRHSGSYPVSRNVEISKTI